MIFLVYRRANLDFDILLEIFGTNLAEISKFKRESASTIDEKWQKTLYQNVFENDTSLAILDVHLHMNCTSLGTFEASDLGHSAESTSTNTTSSKSRNCKRIQQPASSYI